MHSELDVLVVGGGVIGCAVARELSKYELKIALVEKESDVCNGASKANSGVIHSGIYSEPSSLKARLCVQGNKLFPMFAKELGVEFKRIGKLVVARNDGEVVEMEKLKEMGERNQVPGLKIVDQEELRKLEQNISGIKALKVPTAGILSPYELTIALAENALVNGIQIFLNTEVLEIYVEDGYFKVKTSRPEFKVRYLVNCAGLNCDTIAKMVGAEKRRVYPCRGEYLVLDKSLGYLINHMIYPVPEKGSGGLGIHLTPTMEGNILIGPSAEYIENKDDVRTTKNGIEKLWEGAVSFLPDLSKNTWIQSYAGVRCKLVGEDSAEQGDFVIEEDRNHKGFINIMGIESPGLSASPAIAEMVVNIIEKSEALKVKKEFKPRKAGKRFDHLDLEAKTGLIEENPKYGHLICRCENVTKQEIIDALSNPLGVRTLSGIKYRSRAMMGRCQGGFCRPKIIGIMEELYQLDMKDITLRGEGSFLFIGRTKDLRRHDKKER